MSDQRKELLLAATLLLLLCTHAAAQVMPNDFTLPGAGLPVFILVVIAGVVYWRVLATAREKELNCGRVSVDLRYHRRERDLSRCMVA